MRIVPLAVLSLVLAAPCFAARADDLPSAKVVIDRLINKAAIIAADTNAVRYVYLKTTSQEELDDEGKVRSRKEKVYEVKLIGGMPHPRLIRINGQGLSPAQIQRENDKEEALRRKVADEKSTSRRDMVLTPDLAERFQFTVVRRERVQDRSAIVLTFIPKSGPLPEKRIADRVVNKLSGTIWVDEEDNELAKVDLKLSEEVSLLGGVLGSLRSLTMILERDRLPNGIWFNKDSAVTIKGRKLFTSIYMRARERADGIRPEPVTRLQ